jgi:hypothetical protein
MKSFRTRNPVPRAAKMHTYFVRAIAVLFLAVFFLASGARAQIVGNVEANIPFQFHVGSTKLPPGKYDIHVLDDSDLTVMEISSADGRASALFQVESAQAKSAPSKSELIFNKYGNRYFLSEVFDGDNPDGSRVVGSRYEQKLGQGATPTQEHVPATHHKPQSK